MFRSTEPDSYCQRVSEVYQRVISVVDTVRSAAVQDRDEESQSPSSNVGLRTVNSHNQHALKRKAGTSRHQSLQSEHSENISTTTHSRRNYLTPSLVSAGSTAPTTRGYKSPVANIPTSFPSTTTALKHYDGAMGDAPFYGNAHQASQATEAERWHLSMEMEPNFDFSTDALLRDSELNHEPPIDPNIENSIFSWKVD